MTSYILMSGSGLLKNLSRRANRKKPGVSNNNGEQQGFVRMSFSFKMFRKAILTTDALIAPDNNSNNITNGDKRYEVKGTDADDNDRNGNVVNCDDKVVELESQEGGSN